MKKSVQSFRPHWGLLQGRLQNWKRNHRDNVLGIRRRKKTLRKEREREGEILIVLMQALNDDPLLFFRQIHYAWATLSSSIQSLVAWYLSVMRAAVQPRQTNAFQFQQVHAHDRLHKRSREDANDHHLQLYVTLLPVLADVLRRTGQFESEGQESIT